MANEITPRTLYIVATPIGNLSDISERALKVLRDVDIIAAEDTRVSGNLLKLFGIKQKIINYFEHNKTEMGEKIINELILGNSVALVTDAGTPAISDPGEDLVKLAHKNGIKVVPIPGACAAITALSASGMKSRRFAFEGFLPNDKKERIEVLESYVNEKKTVIFYEAPHRLKETLDLLYEYLGDRQITLARELTKLNEEFCVTTLKKAVKIYSDNAPRGEFVLIVSGKEEKNLSDSFWFDLDIEQHVEFYEKQGLKRMDAIKSAARDRGVSKNTIYKELI